MKTAECRSCGEPIIWTLTSKGKRMPVDAEPVGMTEGGSLFRLVEEFGEVMAEYVPDAQHAGDPELYRSHFATCPQADQHRRPR